MHRFTEHARCYDGVTRRVLRRGEGPGVVLIHEIPGITPALLHLAERITELGMTVFLPSLLGQPGRRFAPRYAGESILRACIRREFTMLARRGSSPITHWLRALCRDVHTELGGPGVGVIGMCLTGNFALTLLADAAVIAPVLSQPSLPLPLTPSRRAALQLTEAERARIQQRAAAEDLTVLGLRFTHDVLCPASRFTALRALLGDRFEAIEIDSGPGNPHRISRIAHAVLTLDLIDEHGHPTQQALERVLGFLSKRLLAETLP